jgi:hypothetical protein
MPSGENLNKKWFKESRVKGFKGNGQLVMVNGQLAMVIDH